MTNECIKKIARIKEACNDVLIVDFPVSTDARNLAIKVLKMIKEEEKRS